MPQDIRAATIWYEYKVTQGGAAERTLQKVRYEYQRNKESAGSLDRALGSFFTKSKLGWLGFGLTAKKALDTVISGSTALTDLLSIPKTFLESIGTAIDVAFPGFLAEVERLKAEATAAPIRFGLTVKEEGLQMAVEDAIAGLAIRAIEVPVRFFKESEPAALLGSGGQGPTSSAVGGAGGALPFLGGATEMGAGVGINLLKDWGIITDDQASQLRDLASLANPIENAQGLDRILHRLAPIAWGQGDPNAGQTFWETFLGKQIQSQMMGPSAPLGPPAPWTQQPVNVNVTINAPWASYNQQSAVNP